MNLTTLKMWAALLGSVAIAFLIQAFFVPDADELLKGARSEVTVEALSARFERPTTRAVAAETRGAPTTQPSRGPAPAVDFVPPPASPIVAALPHERPKPMLRLPWPWSWILRALALADDNRAINDATAAEIQTPPTNEMITMADPLIPISGEMTLQFPVVKVAGSGLDFSFVVSYRSGFSYDGPIGKRWEHNWNARFKYVASHVIQRMAGNRVDAYVTKSGQPNDYESPAGFAYEKSITRYYDGSKTRIERRLRDGTLEIYKELSTTSPFTNWYFLTDVQHRDSDNAIALAYDGNQRLQAITDTRGKNFTLTYDSNSRVSTFEDWSGGGASRDRQWTFAYSGGDLTKVTAPLSRETTFTYTGTNLLESIRAPREGSGGTAYLTNTYDSATPPRVTHQTLGGGTFTMTYGASATTETDREGGKRIFQWGDQKEITKIRREVTAGTYADTSIEWNTNDALPTKITYPEGNGVQLRYDGTKRMTASIRCNSSGIGSTDTPSQMRSSSNFLVTEYVYQTASNWDMLTRITDPVGSNWDLVRDSLGNVTSYKTPQHTADPYVIAYDSRSRVDTIDDPEGRRVGFVYGSSRTLSQVIVDPAGSLVLTTTLSRDIFENVTKVKDPENRETTYARNTLGFVTKVTTPLGAETDYLYDANDVVTETRTDVGISGLNAERVITYSRNIMDLVTDVIELSKTTTYAYDKNDRVTLVTLPESARKIRPDYDLRGLETSRTVAEGTSDSFTEVMEYDGNGRLVTNRNGLDNEAVFEYDGFDRLTQVTDPEVHYRTTAYDKNGNVVTMKRFASGDSTEFAADASEYDLNNRLTKSRRWAKKADRSTNLGSSEWMDTTLTYDKSGKLITKADPCGCGGSTNTVYFYDPAGRLTKTKDAATNEVTYALDKSGLVTKVTRSEKESGTTVTYVVEYAYNSDRHLVSVSEKGGGSASAHATSYQVDKMGRATKVVDANSNEVLYDFDDLARMTRTRRGAGSDYITTATTYDLNDNVLTETSVRPGATDAKTRYVYDNADRMVTMKDESDVAVKILVYDDASNVITRKDGNGSEVRPAYDKRNLVTQINYTLATNVVGPTKVKFSYDGLGRVIAAVNQRADVVDSRTYDARVERTWNTLSGLEKEKTWINPSGEDGTGSTPREVEYVHDGSGRVSLIKYPEGSSTRTVVKRAYDALNRVTSITRQDPGTSGWTSVATWVFQGPGRMTTMESGNTAKETMRYDEYGRATEMIHDRLQATGTRRNMFKFKRFYDAGDRVVKEKREYFFESDTALTGDRDFGDIYVYDPQNRLATVVRGVGAATNSHSVIDSATDSTTDFSTKTHYTFDPGGNRKTLRYDVPSGTRRREDHAFDIENQLTTRTIWDWDGSQLTQTASAGLNYDANGTLTVASVVKVDVQNRIYEIGSWRYRYDPFGRRVEKRDTGGTYWRRCYYEGVVCVAEWHTALSSGTPTESSSGPMWVRAFGTYLVDQALWAKVDPCGTCGSYVSGYFHLDFLGSSVMVTSAAANGSGPNAGGYDILETYRYDEYGQPYFFLADGTPLSASLAGQDYLYTGREWASEHGASAFYFYRARYYDQTSGRFLSRDPSGSDVWLNQYAYAENDPVVHRDPTGLAKEREAGSAIAIGTNERLNHQITPVAASMHGHVGPGPGGGTDPIAVLESAFQDVVQYVSRDNGCTVYSLALVNKRRHNLTDEQTKWLQEAMFWCMKSRHGIDVKKCGVCVPGPDYEKLRKCKEDMMNNSVWGIQESLVPTWAVSGTSPFSRRYRGCPPPWTSFQLIITTRRGRHALSCQVIWCDPNGSGRAELQCENSPDQGYSGAQLDPTVTVGSNGAITSGQYQGGKAVGWIG